MTDLDHVFSRRGFVGAATAAALGARRWLAQPGPIAYVGTYTANTKSEGVYAFRLDAASGALTRLGAWDAGPNPSFLAAHRERRALYAVNEIGDYEGRPSGGVSSLAAAADGALSPRGRVASEGRDPCYVSLDHTGGWALVANYSSGTVATFRVGAGGALSPSASVARHQGTGPDRDRQEGPHAHCVITDPTNRYAICADLGIDHLMVYRFDTDDGSLTPAATPFVATKPGAGPRHLAFDPSGRTLFVANELDLTLASYRWGPEGGTLAPLHSAPLAPGLTRGKDSAADIHVAPSGRFVYATVRGANLLVVFRVDANGTLTPVQRVPTGGDWPRNFALDPSGRFLYVANQRSNDIVGFTVDATTGRVTASGLRVAVPAPVCIRFWA